MGCFFFDFIIIMIYSRFFISLQFLYLVVCIKVPTYVENPPDLKSHYFDGLNEDLVGEYLIQKEREVFLQ
jgi:hypothetical protein